MNRRKFFQATGTTAIALSLPMSVKAAEGDQKVMIEELISANHGHAVGLSMAQIVELFAMTNDGAIQEISIQGQSGHPHTLGISQDMLVALLADREIVVVAGHAHKVVISVDLVV